MYGLMQFLIVVSIMESIDYLEGEKHNPVCFVVWIWRDTDLHILGFYETVVMFETSVPETS